MKEEINEKTQYRLMLTVLAIVIVLLLFLVGLLIRHGKQVNPDTIEVKPQQLIMGTELEEIEIIPIDVAYLVCSEVRLRWYLISEEILRHRQLNS